jgi:ABC-type nitrate/sulfonate/bicarbonate transport system substrate-binding protein
MPNGRRKLNPSATNKVPSLVLYKRGKLSKAQPDQLAKLLTALIRGDRLCEGMLAGAFESGLLPAILQRAKKLSQDDWP